MNQGKGTQAQQRKAGRVWNSAVGVLSARDLAVPAELATVQIEQATYYCSCRL
jgi:hypothetical protein